MSFSGILDLANARPFMDTGATPPIATEASYTIETDQVILVAAIRLNYIVSGTARVTSLVITRNTVDILRTKAGGNLNPGTWQLCYMAGITPPFASHTDATIGPLPVPLYLQAGDVITTVTSTITGDQYSAITLSGLSWLQGD